MEAIRALMVAKRTARSVRIGAINQARALAGTPKGLDGRPTVASSRPVVYARPKINLAYSTFNVTLSDTDAQDERSPSRRSARLSACRLPFISVRHIRSFGAQFAVLAGTSHIGVTGRADMLMTMIPPS